jgi:hypothetical protein
VAPQGIRVRRVPSHDPQLDAKQTSLFRALRRQYNSRSGRTYRHKRFDALSLSQQTTFDAVTHALMRSELTDEAGRPLGSPIDLLEGIDRIAGQYAGRSGDQQFRLYVRLKPEARAVLDKSREFFRDHDNTVYHVGYPDSHRQIGKEPNIQFSLSEDGRRADIDVDYRSADRRRRCSTAIDTANSDVRVGQNPRLHNGAGAGSSRGGRTSLPTG